MEGQAAWANRLRWAVATSVIVVSAFLCANGAHPMRAQAVSTIAYTMLALFKNHRGMIYASLATFDLAEMILS